MSEYSSIFHYSPQTSIFIKPHQTPHVPTVSSTRTRGTQPASALVPPILTHASSPLVLASPSACGRRFTSAVQSQSLLPLPPFCRSVFCISCIAARPLRRGWRLQLSLAYLTGDFTGEAAGDLCAPSSSVARSRIWFTARTCLQMLSCLKFLQPQISRFGLASHS